MELGKEPSKWEGGGVRLQRGAGGLHLEPHSMAGCVLLKDAAERLTDVEAGHTLAYLAEGVPRIGPGGEIIQLA